MNPGDIANFDPDDPFLGATQQELDARMAREAALQPRPVVAPRPAQPVPQGQPVVRAPLRLPAYGATMYDNGMNMAFGGFNSAMAGAREQNSNLQGMANDVMGAIRRENDSRVAQERERRRMEHERAMAQQRIDLERERIASERARDQMNAANQIRMLKAQMAMQNPLAPRRSEYRMDPTTGQGRWVEDWEM